ncbi:GNAT family N-acetyltransferase [Amycolatopsis keratiniphila]|uniref:GNAT family N-acetyltransferase n=1 Tax=Amycolatopsis keratiniphila subsp. keratiniphila TaxID=227715 RepID=A0A1W2LQ08_9PSEU|nr:GNAT family N-acetyltransferase [Amycolatopsis keratiniphila]ONF66098.1 GNAT family N-acetyltransferase [Amycolatopsis keratiniphila subsp. keratiniphila]
MTWSFEVTPVDHPDAAQLLREYLDEIASRFYERQVSEEELDDLLEKNHSRDLTPPTGTFLLARRDGVLAGCAGLRVASPDITELTRVFLRKSERGKGGAALLVAAAEDVARGLGASLIRLDTRRDLVEARALYARLGYEEVERFNDEPFAHHFFAKSLEVPDRV